MRTVRIAIATPVLASLALAFFSGQAVAAAPAIVTASYTISYTCTSGCSPGPYVHDYAFVVDCTGALTGTGTQQFAPDVVESVSGTVWFDQDSHTIWFQYTSVYTSPPELAGYTVVASGTIDRETGALTGAATASGGGQPDQAFDLTGAHTSASADHSACTGQGGGGDGDGGGHNWVDGMVAAAVT